MVHNVHCLLHIPIDVKAFGSVDAFSAYPFESVLYRLKRMVRSGRSPLVHEFTITAQRPNKSYPLRNSQCCEVPAILSDKDENNKSKIMCRVFDNVQPLFNQPCSGNIIRSYKTVMRNSRLMVISIDMLTQNAIMIENGKNPIILGILHKF